MPFLSHLIELRERLLRAVLSVLLIFLGLFYFANTLFTALMQPIVQYLPKDAQLIAVDVASPFLAPLKFVFILSIFAAMPYILAQLWGFISPGLYKHEQKLIRPLIISTALLFYAGAAFAYFIIFPIVFNFFISVAPEGVNTTPDISRYLDFVLGMFFAFGLAFETPVLIVLLIWSGLTSAESLAKKRPYIIVMIFILAMFLTPPDIFSQSLLAGPMILLFELGLVLSRMIAVKRETAQDETEGIEDYQPLTEEEMDAELAKIDAEAENQHQEKNYGAD